MLKFSLFFLAHTLYSQILVFSAIQQLIQQNVRCIILTSGTLYPIEPIEAELNL